MGFFIFLNSITGARIAGAMQTRYFALPFAFNTFISLLLQTIVQVIIGNALNMNIFHRFYVFSVGCAIHFSTTFGLTDIGVRVRNSSDMLVLVGTHVLRPSQGQTRSGPYSLHCTAAQEPRNPLVVPRTAGITDGCGH